MISNPFENGGRNQIAIPIENKTNGVGRTYFCVEQTLRAQSDHERVSIDLLRKILHRAIELGIYDPAPSCHPAFNFGLSFDREN